MRHLHLIATAIALTLTAIAATGCTDANTRPADESTPPPPQAVAEAGTVDSIFPIEEEIRRFSAAVGEQSSALAGGAASMDELVTGFIDALERSDTAALRQTALNAAEFIDLYFPHTVYTVPPYQMDPAIIWFQLQNHGSRGITRALNRYGGSELEFRDYACPSEPTIEGPNRVWEGCRVRLGSGSGETELRLFGPVIEREGRYKFVSYANDL